MVQRNHTQIKKVKNMENTKTNKNLNVTVKYSGFDTLKEALDAHRAWILNKEDGKCANLSRADLNGAYLRGADLNGADLSSANLSGVNLSSANLSGVNLSDAYLSGANLSGAYLRDANLSRANLSRTDLSGANLIGVKLSGAKLENGLSWEKYLSEVVPALCVAGGKSLEEVAAVWDCHSWKNCPMHIAFGVNSIEKIPALYQFEADRFVRFFDQKLIPRPIAE